jgi:hypothetical protein
VAIHGMIFEFEWMNSHMLEFIRYVELYICVFICFGFTLGKYVCVQGGTK